MGGLALWQKDLTADRDPRDSTKPALWGQALAQGGVFSIFLANAENCAGGGLPGTLAGSLIGDVQNLAAIATSKNHGNAAL